MSNRNDISQIKKYLEGKLDAKAMHQLERRALDDPFLQDALDGYAAQGAVKQPQLDALQNRLQQRINRKEAKIIPWRWLSVAAAIILVAGIGIMLMRHPQPKQPNIALNTTVGRSVSTADTTATDHTEAANKPVAPRDTPAPLLAVNPVVKKQAFRSVYKRKQTVRQATVAEENASPAASDALFSNATVANATPAQKDSSANALSDMIMNEFAAQRRHRDSVKKARQQASQFVKLSPDKKVSDTAYLHSLTAKVAGVTTNADFSAASNAQQAHLVNGVLVMDNRSGSDIQFGNADKLKANQSNMLSGYSDYGYAAGAKSKRKRSVLNIDSLNAALSSNIGSLREVAISSKDKNGDNQPAHPSTGWDAFNNYLKDNTATADGTTGLVKLSFTVSTDGSLSNFKVLQSISKANDAKAIDLIKNGAAWLPGSTQKAETVTLSIQFH